MPEKYALEFVVSLFFVVLAALGVVLRLYVGRLVQRLDQVGKQLEEDEKLAQRKWEEHTEQTAIRQLDIEKRLSRCELIAETLFQQSAIAAQHKRRSEGI